MPVLVDEMFALFEVQRRGDTTSVLPKQNVGMALAFADWAYVLYGDRMMHEWEAAAMLANDDMVNRYRSV